MRLGWLVFAIASTCAAVSCSSSSTNPGEGPGTGGDGNGCADGSVEQKYAGNMVGCDGLKSQCEAELLCATGWHLCPLSEFAERGGAVTPANGLRWLRACIRNYDDQLVTCPTNTPCDVCSSSSAPPAPVSWECNGTELESHAVAPLGVVSSSAPSPRVVGCTSKPVCAYLDWDEAPDEIGAVCCL